MKKVENYLFPKDLAETLSFLKQYEGEARIVSGATDLTLWIKEGKVNPKALVDVSALPEMRSIEIKDGKIIIGAAMTHAEIAADSRIKEYFTALADGCRSVGSPQIRNVGTLAGNIVSAQPAADSVVPMTALDAVCEIFSSEGNVMKPLSELSKSVGVSYVDPTKEVISRIFLEIPKCRYGTSFKRIAPREAMALPVVNVAVMLKADSEGMINEARIVASPVAVIPFRAKKAEEFLCGKAPSKELFEEAARIAGDEASPRDSLERGSGAYRKSLVRDLVGQALIDAAKGLA